MWRLLRNRQLAGFKFRRQHPCWAYILDFYSPRTRVVVELDGDSHTTDEAHEHDRIRHEYLTRRGLLTLRFWNTDVFDNPDGVLETILATCTERTRSHELSEPKR